MIYYVLDVESICVAPSAGYRNVLGILQNASAKVCVVISPGGKVVGTITDGDCRRAFLKGDPSSAKASEIMNMNLVMVDKTFSPAQIEALMNMNGVDQIPIVDEEGRLLDIAVRKSNQPLVNDNQNTPVVIMAGGRGKRLMPLTNFLPKPMLPVNGRPLLERLVVQLTACGFHNLYISVNYLSKVIEKHFGDGKKWDCSIQYLEEEEELGTAGPLRLLDRTGIETVVVVNGDILTLIDFAALLDFHTKNENQITLSAFMHRIDVPFGMVSLDKVGTVTELVEKPSYLIPVSAGIYVLNPKLLERIPASAKYDMTDLINETLASKEKVGCFHVIEPWLDIGTPSQFFVAQEFDK